VTELQDAAGICRLIAASPFHLAALRSVSALALPDWWIGAGFVRSLVWDHLHRAAKPTLLGDIDVIWFDTQRRTADIDDALTTKLRAVHPGVPWSIKNQARMHERNGDRPYRSSLDAMCHWPETATAVAVTLSNTVTLNLAAPFGTDDLLTMVVRPTPHFRQHRMDAYRARQNRKNWRVFWPLLRDVPD
jgi:uncharacterized protein